jgi:hypothetical protein
VHHQRILIEDLRQEFAALRCIRNAVRLNREGLDAITTRFTSLEVCSRCRAVSLECKATMLGIFIDIGS